MDTNLFSSFVWPMRIVDAFPWSLARHMFCLVISQQMASLWVGLVEMGTYESSTTVVGCGGRSCVGGWLVDCRKEIWGYMDCCELWGTI